MVYSNLIHDRYGKLREMFKTLGSKQGDKFVRSQTQINQFRQWWNTIKDGTMITATYKVFRPSRSQNQINAHFGLVVEMIRKQMGELGWDICGVLPNKDIIHEILKKCCGGVGENGETMGLSEMNTEQASKFFENCRTWATTQLNLNIPDPDPAWRTKNDWTIQMQ